MNPVPFKEAIDWAKARKVVLPDTYYGELQGLARSMSFSVAGMTQLDQLQSVLDDLNESIEKGESFAKWKKRAAKDLGDLPDHRIETIFRTNIQGAYGRGRCEQQARTVDAQPYLMYDAVNDSRTRPSHAAMDGFVARHDDPIWSEWRPPAGYNCRCRVIALSEEQAGQFIAADERKQQDPENSAARQTARPDKGWDYDPCAEPDEGLRRAWEDKVGAAHPALAEEARLLLEKAEKTPQWVILEGEEATLEAIQALGKQRLDDLMSLVTPDDASLIPAITDRGKMVNELVEGAEKEPRLLVGVLGWWRSELKSQLERARPVGGKLPITSKKGKGKAVTERVQEKLPASWIEKIDQQQPYKVKYKEKSRGWHNGYTREIELPLGSAAEHEWIHAVQTADERLDGLFQALHRQRTAGEPLQWLGGNYGESEQGRRDKYIDVYFGKEYGDRGALEVMTMTNQAILGDDYTANILLSRMMVDDPKLLELALGALFHYK